MCNADAVVWLMAVSAGNPAEARSLSQKPVGGTLRIRGSQVGWAPPTQFEKVALDIRHVGVLVFIES